MEGRKFGFGIAVRKLGIAVFSSACAMTMLMGEDNSGWQKWPYEMNVARSQFSTTKMGGGKLLIAGGYDGNKGNTYASTEIMDTTTGKSTLTASMNEKRAGHTATLLGNGKVLVVGGYYYDSSSGSTDPIYVSKPELFNGTGWQYSAELEKGFSGHTATILNDGKVLVVGGYNEEDGQLAECRIYDPTTGLWLTVPDMGTPRTGHTANLLNDGKVIVVGGYNSKDGYLASSEIYDPATDTWKATGNLYAATAYHAAVLLSGTGKVLAIGGSNAPGTPVKIAQLFDPITGAWGAVDDMEFARMHPAALCLPTGDEVIVAGGMTGIGKYDNHIESYNPTENRWTTGGTLRNSRAKYAIEYLGENKVLFIGGQSADNLGYSKYLSKSEVFDIKDKSVSSPGLMGEARTRHYSVMLDDERVFVAGGQNFNNEGERNTVKSVFDYEDGKWYSLNDLSEGRTRFKAIKLVNGKVLIIGGFATYESIANTTFSSCQIYDPETNEYTNAASMKTPRCDASAIRLKDGRVLIVGGVNIQGSKKAVLKSAEIYDPVEDKWTEIPDINNARSEFNIHLFSGDEGRVLIGGGKGENGESLDSCQIYDPQKNVWTDAAPMSQRRAQFEVTASKPYPYRYGGPMATGGRSSEYLNSEPRQGAENTCEIYDTETETWSNVSPMLESRYAHTATALNDGRILVAGGYNGYKALSSTEIYDPEKDEWTSAGNMSEARFNHTATLLPDGKVMICGGESFDALDTVELFDPGSAPPVTDGTIQKLSFTATYKDSLKKGASGYQKHCANKFTVQTAILFGQDFNPDDIKEGDTFAVNFGSYTFSGTFGNTIDKSKSFKSKPGKGGTAKFANKALDQLKNKQVLIEKIDIRWDAKGKLTVKVSGTPVTDSTTNVTDLSGYKDGKNITGTIDVFTLTFGSHGASFDEGGSLSFTGKKATKTVTKGQAYKLINWSAKGPK